VVRCYEAGREGFWLHRYWQAQGLTNHGVDSSAIEVNRRKRRAKSDGLDVHKLLTMLMRFHHGERDVWRVVHVPTVEAEAQRHLHRDLATLKHERASTTTRLKGLLSGQGIRLTRLSQFPGFCRKIRFLGKIQKSGVRNSMTYRLPNSRKSNFATEPHGDVLTRYCRTWLGEALAEEVTLEVFIAAFDMLPQYRPEATLRAWLFGIAKLKCLKEFRNRTRRQAIIEAHTGEIRACTQGAAPSAP
jgi:hypothetical protein